MRVRVCVLCVLAIKGTEVALEQYAPSCVCVCVLYVSNLIVQKVRRCFAGCMCVCACAGNQRQRGISGTTAYCKLQSGQLDGRGDPQRFKPYGPIAQDVFQVRSRLHHPFPPFRASF